MGQTHSGESVTGASVRALTAADFEAVVALDLAVIDRSRRGYFDKRLAAALRRPADHIQLAADADDAGLVGFLLARIVSGEFDRTEPTVMLEAIAVAPQHQQHGIGRQLLAELEDLMRRKGIHELVTQAEWTNRAMLRFLGECDFTLAPRLILELPVDPTASV